MCGWLLHQGGKNDVGGRLLLCRPAVLVGLRLLRLGRAMVLACMALGLMLAGRVGAEGFGDGEDTGHLGRLHDDGGGGGGMATMGGRGGHGGQDGLVDEEHGGGRRCGERRGE